MKILWITKEYSDFHVHNVARIELIKQVLKFGHEATLFGLFRKLRKDFGLGNHYIQFPARFDRIRILSHLYQMIIISVFIYYTVLIHKWDIVILNFQTAFSIIPLKILSTINVHKTRFILDIRTVPNEIGSIRERLLEWQFNTIMMFSKKLLDGLTVITPAMKEVLIEKYSLNGNQIGIFSSGVDIELFSPKHTKKLHDYETKFKDKFVVFFHGALSEMKGIDKAIYAMKILNHKYGEKIVLFILSYGRLKDAYERLVEDLSLQANVYIENVVPYESVPSYINLINIGIMPYYDIDYWNTSNPIKLLEYLAMEKPVIVSDIRSHRDVIGNSPCGIYICNNSPETIAQAIEKAYKLSDKLKEYGKQARQIIAEKYTWDKCATDFLTYVKSASEK